MNGSGRRPISGGPDHSTQISCSGHATGPVGWRGEDADWGRSGGTVSTLADGVSAQAVDVFCTFDGSTTQQIVDTFSIPAERTERIERAVTTPASTDRGTVNLQVFGKNVQSLQSNDREQELFEELRTFSWDVLLLSETWREKAQERWRSEDGHMFCGAGGKKGEQGTGVILHRRWVKGFRAFHAISERVCAIDVDMEGRRMRFIAVYMPHANYDDADVEGVYLQLNGLIGGRERVRRTCVIAGDWNAVVGPQQLGDDGAIVGVHGVGTRNERGEWMAQWATTQRLMIVNTTVQKSFDEQWTYENGGVMRQLDYCFINVDKASWIIDAGARDDIGVGKDHRATRATLSLPAYERKKKQTRGRKSLRGWQPCDVKQYQDKLDAKLESCPSDDLDEHLQERCQAIERILVDIADKCRCEVEESMIVMDSAKQHLHDLIEQRRSERKAGLRNAVKDTSKLIQKEIKAVTKARSTARVTKVLEEFMDLQRIAGIRSNGKTVCVGSMIDKNGIEKTEIQEVADVFADFFESIYKDTSRAVALHEVLEEIPPATPDEVRSELRKLKRRKAPDEGGIVAELLSSGSDKLIMMIADIFTDVMKPQTAIPEYWKASAIKVLFKKGDMRYPEHYRPICIVPILYKLFSKVVCGRIKRGLIAEQSYDQAGFRPDFSCDDHLFAVTLLTEKCNEFNRPLWVATIDFKRAFDSISHASIWEALNAQKVPSTYVNVLSRLYQGQNARVRVDCTSRKFDIQKGTKQGDPISPIIFNAVLEQVMRAVKSKWRARKIGMQLGHSPESVLTNLRFADDILLVGRSLHQIKQMIADVAAEGAKVGLELHPSKTKILHNNMGYGSRVQEARIAGMVIEVLDPTSSTMYLGRALTLTDMHNVELNHRLKKAWAKFGVYKQELTDRRVPLGLRMKLFHSVVTPTILYGSGSWVMTGTRENALRSTQMKMLRAVLGRGRIKKQPDEEVETWVEWIQRVTHEARLAMKEHKVPDWIEEQRKRLQAWRQKLDSMSKDRWATKVLNWSPEGYRSRGRPLARWSDQAATATLSPQGT